MADVLDIAELNTRALAHRADVLAKLTHPGGRVSPELLALNRDAPRLPSLHVRLSESGHWVATTDRGCVSGRGVCQLVAALADVDTNRAAAWLGRQLPPETRA